MSNLVTATLTADDRAWLSGSVQQILPKSEAFYHCATRWHAVRDLVTAHAARRQVTAPRV